MASMFKAASTIIPWGLFKPFLFPAEARSMARS